MVRCNGDYSAYTKVFTGEQFNTTRIKISMQGAPDMESAKVTKLVIHPNYFSYTGNTVVGNTDLALLRLDRDLFQLEGGKIVGNIAPICLPAKLGFRVKKNQTKDGIHQPFEDLDCFLIEGKIVPWCSSSVFPLLFQPTLLFPIPTTRRGLGWAGWPVTQGPCRPRNTQTYRAGHLASRRSALPIGKISTRRLVVWLLVWCGVVWYLVVLCGVV